MDQSDTIVIMGAGPAGIAAALEICRTTCFKVVLVEQEAQVGGISRTIQYRGNRMDIGGHRFFSKSDTVMNWWQEILPTETPENAGSDDVMLVRNRLSRIFYLRKFFDYPISLKWDTLKNLGMTRVFFMGFSYLKAMLLPIKPEKSLEDFFINRFGRNLYGTFFRDYTQKVWGVPCDKIAADWGAQRVKELSVMRILRHAVVSLFKRSGDIQQKDTDTSLIDRFLYPKFGPGHLWENAAQKAVANGAVLLLRHEVTDVAMRDGAVTAVAVRDITTGEEQSIPCRAAISSLPLRELVPMLENVPAEVQNVCDGLVYRDFITVGILADKLLIRDADKRSPIKDNWIYIQEPDVHMGRIQIFNNWSPWLVRDADKTWMGLEYFATEGDALWQIPDDEFIAMAIAELEKLGFVKADDVEDATILRVKKAYPAYFGSYPRIDVVQKHLDGIPNLYPVGRNGMHRYNNMDHSMLSALEAAACISNPALDKSAIWNINAEQQYHESKA